MEIFRLALILIFFNVAGCASTVSMDSLKPLSGKAIQFDNDFTYDISNDFDLPKPKPGSFRGVKAGVYVSEFEDDSGIYYRGCDTCIFWGGDDLKTGKPALVPGGIWIAHNGKEFRLYYYQSFVTGNYQSEVTRQKSKDEIMKSDKSVLGDVGTGVGYAVVDSIIQSGQNDIVFFPKPPKGVSLLNKYKSRN